MRLSMLLALGAGAVLCVAETAKFARAGVVIVDANRFVAVIPEASQSGVTPATGPKTSRDGAGVFGEEIVEQAFTGPSGTAAFGRASQVSIIDETGFDFHGQVGANTTGPQVTARSFLGFTFHVDTSTNYEFRIDYDAVPDLDSQNADNQLDVLELLFTRQKSDGSIENVIFAEDRTFFELFPKNVPNAKGTLAPGRYHVGVTFDAPVTGEQNVDLSYDIGLTLGGDMVPPPPTGIPLPPAAWAGLVTMVIAGVGPRLRRLLK